MPAVIKPKKISKLQYCRLYKNFYFTAYLYSTLNYLNWNWSQHHCRWSDSWDVVHAIVDGPQLDCMVHDDVMQDALHTVRSTKADHETCMGDSFHVVVGKTMSSTVLKLGYTIQEKAKKKIICFILLDKKKNLY